MIDIIKRYLDSNKLPYAILIDGKWGSGKTYYFKNEFETLFNKKIIYTSLNGVNNLNEILIQILAYKFAVIKILNNKNIKFITGLIKSTITLFTNKPIVDITKLDFEGYASLKENEVLIIDDIERMSDKISIPELFGFISVNFTESNDLKVILIADEIKLKDKVNIKHYNEIKEKTIWQTIPFISNIDKSLDGIVENLNNIYFSEFIKVNRTTIIKYLTEYSISNLRTIIYYIYTLYEVFKKCSHNFTSANGTIILNSTLVLCNEFKEGRIDTNRIKTNNYLNNNGIISRGESWVSDGFNIQSIKNPIVDEEKQFIQKYFINGSHDYTFLSSVLTLICEGSFNEVLFSNEISKLNIREIDLIINELDNPYILEQNIFYEKWNKLLLLVDSNDCMLSDLLNVAGVYEFCSLRNIDFEISKSDLYIRLNDRILSINESYFYQYSRNGEYYKKIQETNLKDASKDFLELEMVVLARSQTLFKEGLIKQFESLKNKLSSLNELTDSNFFLLITHYNEDQIIEFVQFAIKNSKIASQIVECIKNNYRISKIEDSKLTNKISTLISASLKSSTKGTVIWANYNSIKDFPKVY